MIVPESIVASDRLGLFRIWLLGRMDLLASVSLPQKVFTGVGANAKTSIVFARRLAHDRPNGWYSPDAFDNLPEEDLPIFMAAPRLDAPGFTLRAIWHVFSRMRNASATRSGPTRNDNAQATSCSHAGGRDWPTRTAPAQPLERRLFRRALPTGSPAKCSISSVAILIQRQHAKEISKISGNSTQSFAGARGFTPRP